MEERPRKPGMGTRRQLHSLSTGVNATTKSSQNLLYSKPDVATSNPRLNVLC
jgi:hypothetical protein